jgi:hypothetical protein
MNVKYTPVMMGASGSDTVPGKTKSPLLEFHQCHSGSTGVEVGEAEGFHV